MTTMEHIEHLLDLAKRADEALEEVRNLLNQAADVPLRQTNGRSVAGDLVRAGWPENGADEQGHQLADQIELTRKYLGSAKAETELLVFDLDATIGKTGRLV